MCYPCSHCGACKVRLPEGRCPFCGAEVPAEGGVCPGCKAKIPAPPGRVSGGSDAGAAKARAAKRSKRG